MTEPRFFHISPEGLFSPLGSLAETIEAQSESGYVWLHYVRPSREELMVLRERFGLHPLIIEDCTDEKQLPKIEDYPLNSFMLFNDFEYVEEKLTIHEVDFVLGKNFLITVSSKNGEENNRIDRIPGHHFEILRHGPAFLLHFLLDRIVDDKFVAVEALENEIDEAEEIILSDPTHFQAAVLTRIRRNLMTIRKSLFHEREILVKICRKDCQFIPEKSIYYFRDVYDHLTKYFELTEASRDTVTSLMEMYLSMLNNQMAKTANETNATMRRLTYITTIFMPLTLLSGIGGMSEWTMMTGEQNWKISYPLFMGGMVLLGLISYRLILWFEKRGKEAEVDETPQ